MAVEKGKGNENMGPQRLPRQDGCIAYVDVRRFERYVITARLWMDESSGRMCEFHISLTDSHNDKLLASADCSDGLAHYHDERDGHGQDSRRGDIGPVSTHDEIESAYISAMDNIVPMCIKLGIVR